MKERTIFMIIIISLVLVVIGFIVAQNVDLTPFLASTRGVVVDRLFRMMLGIATVVFLVVEGGLLYAAIRFRKKPQDEGDALPIHGNNTLEVIWTVIPAILVIVIGVYSFNVLTEIERPGEGEMVVEVIGRQFAWEFRYPEYDLSTSVMHLPVNRPVRLEITSEDVIHSFWVPNFLAKQDATPGRVTTLVVTPTERGVFPARCAELCGPGHATMVTEVVVEAQEEFQEWIGSQQGQATNPEAIFSRYGCNGCHQLSAIGATGIVGPSLEGIGATAATRQPDMSAEGYLRQSILEPNAHVVEGFQAGLMPQNYDQRMTEEELTTLVNFLLEQ